MKHRIIIFLFLLCNQCNGQTDYLHIQEAQSLAAEKEALLLMVFSGSDWCKPCIQFKNDILESTAFQSLNDELLLLYLDFPYKKKNALSKDQEAHNESLAEKYNAEGKFPKILLLNSNGEVIEEIEYQKALTAKSFIDEFEKIKTRL